MDQQSMPSSPSSPSLASFATQPESQDSTFTIQPTTQTQLTQPPPSLSLFSQTTENDARSPQLLVIQPITQIENGLVTAETFQSNAHCSSQWEGDGNDQKILPRTTTQEIPQLCGANSEAMLEESKQIHDVDECNKFSGTIGQNDCIKGAAAIAKDTTKNHANPEEDGLESASGKKRHYSNDSGVCARHDDEQILLYQKTTSSLGATTDTRIDTNDHTIESADVCESMTENSLLNQPLIGTISCHLSKNEVTTATAESNQMLKPPQQRIDSAAIVVDRVSKSGAMHLASHRIKRKVANPYAKNNKPTSAKRTIDQISRCSSSSTMTFIDASNSLDDRPNNPFNAINDTSVSAPRKQVANPYAKPKQTPKHLVRNPYAKVKATTAMRSLTKNDTAKVLSMKLADRIGKERDPPSEADSSKLPQFRRAGISISLPMAERLPSRNVSYQPAEILTVGELYRYLYDRDYDQQRLVSTQKLMGSETAGLADIDPTPITSEELVSVRITGTLLCVSRSHRSESDRATGNNLYDNGSFLLVGDPLENTRFLNKELSSKQGEGNPNPVAVTPSITTANPKAQLTSILRNKKAPVPPSTMSAAETPSANPAALRSDESMEQPLIAATPDTKLSDEQCNTANAANSSKPVSRGILNTNKKKKLVYSGGGKRLSFGGGGIGGRGGGLLGRKFITPKRVNLPGPLSGAKKDLMNRLGSFTLKKSAFSSVDRAGAGNGKNPKPEKIIQRHHSPLVPIWIGSFHDGDGLDGSVVGDLVMIMGEIVMEHCSRCQKSIAKDYNSDNKGADENMKEPSSGTNEINNDPNEKSIPHEQMHKPLATPTRIQGVNDAAIAIAACAMRISARSPASESPTITEKTKSTTFCCRCTRFLRARFVKNANGTDVSLQREALRVRRKYLAERKMQMECLMPTSLASQGLYSIGCGPPI